MLQYFHKTFIFNCGWSKYHILLFYFDLQEIDTLIIVKILCVCIFKRAQTDDLKNKKLKKKANKVMSSTY